MSLSVMNLGVYTTDTCRESRTCTMDCVKRGHHQFTFPPMAGGFSHTERRTINKLILDEDQQASGIARPQCEHGPAMRWGSFTIRGHCYWYHSGFDE